MTDSMNPAVEGLFDPEATTDALLATVKENISKKITSVDQAADLENRLSEEAAEFNQMLTTISTAMRQCEAGEISKDEAMAAAAPCVKALKERCSALQLADTNVKDEDITEGEIAMLREFIVGCKDIVAAHKKALQDCALTNNEANAKATEGVLSSIAGMTVAQEGLFDPKLLKTVRNSADAKNAALLYKNAKKLYSMGSKEKAKDYMQKAKEKYQKCLDEAKKAGKEKKITRVTAGAFGVMAADIDKNKKVYGSVAAYQVVAYFEDRIDTCEAYLRQWTNKAGNKDLKETKAQLKEERKAEKARIREAKKLAAGPNPNKNLISNADKAKEFASKATNLADATAQSTKDIKFGANSRKIAKQSAGATVDTSTPSGIKKALNRMSVILGRWNTTDSKVAALKKKVANLENVVNDLNAKGNPNGALVYAEEIGKLNAEINALLGKAPESYTAFEGAGFLGYLAMEEANFSDEIPLPEIENEEGRGFSDDAEGSNLIEDAVVGAEPVEEEDDECDEGECEESVLESSLAIFKLEDGLDPDED